MPETLSLALLSTRLASESAPATQLFLAHDWASDIGGRVGGVLQLALLDQDLADVEGEREEPQQHTPGEEDGHDGDDGTVLATT